MSKDDWCGEHQPRVAEKPTARYQIRLMSNGWYDVLDTRTSLGIVVETLPPRLSTLFETDAGG